MSIRIDKRRNQQLVFYSMLFMLLFLFTSRALLSVSLILFLFFTCFHKKFNEQFKTFLKNPFLIGMSLLFFIPFVSGLWSADQHMWLRFVRIKLPLLFLPLAFAGNWQLSSKQWRWVAYVFLFLVFAGCCWSLWQYAQNTSLLHKEYLKAKIFSTPLDNDHVRFSLLACIAIVCAVVVIHKTMQKITRFILAGACIFFIVYLHILSARTGLIAFYIFILLGIFYFIFLLKKIKWVAALLVLMMAMPVAAWFLLPTFQNRIRYNFYDLSNVSQNKYAPGSNDGSRILSLKAGWYVLKQHPFGVGGDVVNKTFAWYDANTPYKIPESQKLFPSSEVLMYAGFAGWIGMFLFFLSMALPLFQRTKKYFFWFTLNLIMAFSFLFDIGLEAQFGVFIYAFIILWWWKWFAIEQTNL